MKILPTRAASVSRQGLCTALLVASLTAAVGVSPPHHTADADEPTPGPDNPQSLPHGTPNLTLPDLRPHSPGGLPGTPGAGGDKPDGSTGIPATALDAYKKAEAQARTELPDCHIPWQLIAGIGKVESEHGTIYGTHLLPDGTTDKPILGPALTGREFALVRDTDGGFWDGDTQYDHAVGPMQFIPSTWKHIGADGNGGYKNPNNIYDAALGTARYLCAGGRDMNKPGDLDKAILSYNPSRAYVKSVVAWMRAYQNGDVAALPDPSGSPSAPRFPGGNTPSSPSAPSSPSTPGTSRPSPQHSQKPSAPSTPGKPKPSEPSKPSKPSEPTKPTPPAPTAAQLERVGAAQWSATVGETFTERARVRALTDGGKPVAGAHVRFEILAPAKAHFDGKDAVFATATTGPDGTAIAPVVIANDQTGQFFVRATVEGRDITPIDFSATVKPMPVQSVVLVGDKPPMPAPSGTFGAIQVRTLAKDKTPLAGVTGMTATVLAADEKTPRAIGPYFKKDGKAVRTITLGPTDEKGSVTLPELFADANPGPYTLRIATADGQELIIHLTVKAS
ncbi:lytic transglycosylase domain-containing protein [Streptomyces sp. NPDC020379]|uniref:lytic transglycosylase domain-containing protein n=1 Tax=Streptomyces sp. NPDC020379 TaxID=3365071 RepID=UPI0037A253B2